MKSNFQQSNENKETFYQKTKNKKEHRRKMV